MSTSESPVQEGEGDLPIEGMKSQDIPTESATNTVEKTLREEIQVRTLK